MNPFSKTVNRLFIALMALALVVLLIGATAAAPAEKQSAQVGATATVNTGALNVRSGPGVAYSVVTVVYQGNVVTLQGRNSNSSWVKIQTGTRTGWVNKSFLTTSASISALPVLSETAPVPVATVNTGALNVRTGPGVTYNVITTVSFGQTLGLLGRESANRWVKVHLPNGQQGWVNASLLNANVAISSLPLTGVPAQPQPSVPVAPNALLSLRSGPSFSSPVVAQVFQGQRVQAIGRNSVNSWVKIRILETGQQGWILSGNVLIDIAIDLLPIVNDHTGPLPTATVPPPTPTVPAPTPTAVSPTPTATSPTNLNAVVNTNSLNVRTGPGESFSILTTLNQGATVPITGRTGDSSWVQVSVNNRLGWVSIQFILISGDLSRAPIIIIDGQTPTGTINTGALNVRSGPGLSFSVTAVVTQGTTVNLIGRNSDSSWLQVRLSNGTVGWLNASYITTSTNISTLPVTG